jgi:hypothetical protein
LAKCAGADLGEGNHAEGEAAAQQAARRDRKAAEHEGERHLAGDLESPTLGLCGKSALTGGATATSRPKKATPMSSDDVNAARMSLALNSGRCTTAWPAPICAFC